MRDVFKSSVLLNVFSSVHLCVWIIAFPILASCFFLADYLCVLEKGLYLGLYGMHEIWSNNGQLSNQIYHYDNP